MAYANPAFGYTHLPAETKPTAYRFGDEDDTAGVLDPSVLEGDNMMQDPSSHQAFRKDSFANSNGVISPADSHGWEPHFALPNAVQTNPPNSGFHEDSTAFMQHQNPMYGQARARPSQQWNFEQTSGNCTPTPTNVDFIPAPPQFEGVQFQQHQRADSAHAVSFPPHQPQPAQPVPQNYGVTRVEANFMQPAPQVQTPMSPHSHQDWMGMAQQEMEARPMSKRMRPNSPHETMVDIARRDGIRKKNGRIDIPAERNIHTIDDMINETNDEELLKELKQQKRLLRNREAALASRQRKKKHTEDLEVKEKSCIQQIDILQKQLADLHMDRQRREQEHMMLVSRYQEAERNVEVLQEQMREMKYQHDEETSMLRKRVNILTEAGPAPSMSAAPSSTGFTDFNAEMEALNMGAQEWDDFFFVNDGRNDTDDFNIDPRADATRPPQSLEKKSSSSTIVPAAAKKMDQRAEQPIASGLLFMLLLCGAFVASKQSNSSGMTELPNMPPHVRAAAPAILNNLLSDASVAPNPNSQQLLRQHTAQEPHPSAQPYMQGQPSRLDQQFQHLTSKSKQQQIDEAFSLTTAEYASITNPNVPIYNEQSGTEPPRRPLAEALNEMHQRTRQNSQAEVYTRSLLWDQIPADVVKQFREMVRDHNELEARQMNDQRNHDNDFSFKMER